jgi:hypothetical protein
VRKRGGESDEGRASPASEKVKDAGAAIKTRPTRIGATNGRPLVAARLGLLDDDRILDASEPLSVVVHDGTGDATGSPTPEPLQVREGGSNVSVRIRKRSPEGDLLLRIALLSVYFENWKNAR